MANRQVEQTIHRKPRILKQNSIRWTWACRLLDTEVAYEIYEDDVAKPPIPGDIALFRVTRIGHAFQNY